MKRKTALWILAGLASLGVVGGGALAVPRLLGRPLATPLALTAPAPAVAPPPAPGATAPPAAQAVCGQSEPVTVLVLLTQEAQADGARRLLALRLVEADFLGRAVRSVFFPRNLVLSTAGLPAVGASQAALEEIYLRGMRAGGDDASAAASLIAQALYDNFGAVSDHYVAIDLSALARTIDSVGGVDVQIVEAYDATHLGLPHFQPGVMHMPGDLALAFATATDPQGSWAGLSRQTQVLKALKDAALTPQVLPRMPELIGQFRQAVITDLSVQQGLDFACLADEVEAGSVAFAGVGPDLVEPQADGALLPRTEEVRRLLEATFVGDGS